MSGEPGKEGVCERFDKGEEGKEADAAVTVDSGLEMFSMAVKGGERRRVKVEVLTKEQWGKRAKGNPRNADTTKRPGVSQSLRVQ